MKHQGPDIEKIYFYVNVPFESKYRSLSKEEKKWGLNNLKIQKVCFDYSQANDDVYKNLKTTTQLRKKVWIVFDDKIAVKKAYEKISPLVADLFLRGIKLNISFVFFITILFESA